MNLQNIPQEIRKLNQWVCAKNNSKVPWRAHTRSPASTTGPETWSSFDVAKEAVLGGAYDYLGFVFNNNSIIGIDIDAGYDEYGLLTPLAAEVIGVCKSYTEKSRSGRGVHVLLRGELPFKGKNNLNGVEIYKQSRYFIMTGDVILYGNITENQQAIDYIVEKYFPSKRDCADERSCDERIYEPVWEKPEKGRIKLRPTYPRIGEGCRNICLTSLGGTLHNLGHTTRQIYDELCYCNKVACEPPLPLSEIRVIVNSVTKYRR